MAANKLASSLALGVESSEVYIKGKVVSIKEQFGTLYGNATFYISDDGTENGQFYVLRTLYLGNKKYTSGTLLCKGDEVVVYGKLTNYQGNTPETVQNASYLFSLNGKTTDESGGSGGGTEPTPSGNGGVLEGNKLTVVYGDLGITSIDNPITLVDGTTLTFSKDDATLTFSGVGASAFKVVNDLSTGNSGGVQLRCTGIVITYEK